MSTPYADVTYANAYFAERYPSDAWDSAESDDKLKALKTATVAIDRLSFAGSLASSSQTNQFPRRDDTVVPEDIKKACCEHAYALLDGVDITFERANLAAGSQGIGGVQTTYDRALTVPHFAAGIASVIAWDFLRPYLRDPRDVEISRDS